jgi:shikimate dehydrogenase
MRVGDQMIPPDAKTKLYLLVGNPVDHSLSPSMHNAAFAALNINSVYLACPIQKTKLYATLEGIKALSVAGANVTSPYKEAVIPFLDSISTESKLLRSVNTIINRNGRLYGESTDGEGFYRSLRETVPGFEINKGIMIVGAGGAARAAAYVMARNGAARFTIVNRTPENGYALSRLLVATAPAVKSDYLPLSRKEVRNALNNCQLIIYGLPFDDTEFIASVLEQKSFYEEKFLFDFRYFPARTAVMSAFEKKGGLAFNGLKMLLWQAVLSFELFTGQTAPVTVMRKVAAV